MQHSKRSEDMTQYIDFLNRRNGELRLEVTFYRPCFQNSERFRESIAELSQDLLHECIIGLLDDTAFEEVRAISKSLVKAVENLDTLNTEAFEAFVAPCRASRLASSFHSQADGSF